MKYLNDVLALVGLALVCFGLVRLFGVDVAALSIGAFLLFVALFKPTLEALRGQHDIKEPNDTESGH